MPVTEVYPSPETQLTQTSVRSLLHPIRQRKFPVDGNSPPIRTCAFRATCKASIYHSDRNDPTCSGSKGH
jgi:hypothetical protein